MVDRYSATLSVAARPGEAGACDRRAPRIDVEAVGWELVDGREASGLIVELSPAGARLERPYLGGPTLREVPLQLEIPEIDEVIWAKGEACFDQLVQTKSPQGGPMGLVRRTGYRISLAARRDLRMLEEYVIETYRQLTPVCGTW